MSGASDAIETVPGLDRINHRQEGAVTRGQLRELGVTWDHVHTQLNARRWTLATRDVVLLHNGPITEYSRRWIAVLSAQEPVAIGSWTALALRGLAGWVRPGVHIVVARGRRPPRVPAVIVHESRRPAPEDIRPFMGLPVHTVQRAAIDAAAWQRHPRTAVGLLAATVQQGLASTDQLFEQLDRVGAVRFRDTMRRSLVDIAGGSQSMAELDFIRFCRDHGLPGPERQSRRKDSQGRQRYLDVEWRLRDGRRLVVEVDGIGHSDPSRWYEDLLRTAELDNSRNDVVIRIPAGAVRLEPGRVHAILRHHLGIQLSEVPRGIHRPTSDS
jgi:hypothetical protein